MEVLKCPFHNAQLMSRCCRPIVRDMVDEVLVVDDTAIAEAMLM